MKVYSKRRGGGGYPSDAVYVGRPTKWGNPFHVGIDGTQEECVLLYRHWLAENPDLRRQAIEELRGQDLVCWCAPLPCHADVLAEISNA